MLRTLLIATALLAASGSAVAHDENYDRGRVVSVEPHFVVSFGTRHHDGFRVLYESGGSRYWTHTRHHPGHVIVLPPSHSVTHAHHYRDHGRGWDKRHDRDERRGWREERREHRGDWGHENHRRHRHHH